MHKLTQLTLTAVFGAMSFQAIAQDSQVLPEAQDTAQTTAPMSAEALSGVFTKKRYSIKGHWSVEQVDGKTHITFDDAFKTKGGPDLKLYLSPNTVDKISGETATDGSVKLGVLKSNRGAQTYIVPDDVSLSDFKSVLIQCESFAVLWGGFDIES